MRKLVTISIGASLVALVFASSAFAAVVVRSAADLAKDPQVANLTQPFMAVASANVIYDQCATAYKLTPEQITFQKELFEEAGKSYLKVFHDAYVARVGAEPEAAMVQQYTDYIQNQQRFAVNRTAETIKDKSCSNGRILKIAQYVEDLRYAELVIQAKQQGKKRPPAPAGSATTAIEDPANAIVIVPTATTAPTAATKPNATTPPPGSH